MAYSGIRYEKIWKKSVSCLCLGIIYALVLFGLCQ